MQNHVNSKVALISKVFAVFVEKFEKVELDARLDTIPNIAKDVAATCSLSEKEVTVLLNILFDGFPDLLVKKGPAGGVYKKLTATIVADLQKQKNKVEETVRRQKEALKTVEPEPEVVEQSVESDVETD